MRWTQTIGRTCRVTIGFLDSFDLSETGARYINYVWPCCDVVKPRSSLQCRPISFLSNIAASRALFWRDAGKLIWIYFLVAFCATQRLESIHLLVISQICTINLCVMQWRYCRCEEFTKFFHHFLEGDIHIHWNNNMFSWIASWIFFPTKSNEVTSRIGETTQTRIIPIKATPSKGDRASKSYRKGHGPQTQLLNFHFSVSIKSEKCFLSLSSHSLVPFSH